MRILQLKNVCYRDEESHKKLEMIKEVLGRSNGEMMTIGSPIDQRGETRIMAERTVRGEAPPVLLHQYGTEKQVEVVQSYEDRLDEIVLGRNDEGGGRSPAGPGVSAPVSRTSSEQTQAGNNGHTDGFLSGNTNAANQLRAGNPTFIRG